jgi:hypothetical protein
VEGSEAKPETLEWRIFLLGSEPKRGLMALAVSAITLWFVHDFAGSAWITGFAAFILLASLSNFLLPTRYRLDETHVLIRNPLYWRRRAWTEFRAISHRGDRVNLRTLPHESRLDHYRGMLIIMDPARGGEILAFISQHIGEDSHGSA